MFLSVQSPRLCRKWDTKNSCFCLPFLAKIKIRNFREWNPVLLSVTPTNQNSYIEPGLERKRRRRKLINPSTVTSLHPSDVLCVSERSKVSLIPLTWRTPSLFSFIRNRSLFEVNFKVKVRNNRHTGFRSVNLVNSETRSQKSRHITPIVFDGTYNLVNLHYTIQCCHRP